MKARLYKKEIAKVIIGACDSLRIEPGARRGLKAERAVFLTEICYGDRAFSCIILPLDSCRAMLGFRRLSQAVFGEKAKNDLFFLAGCPGDDDEMKDWHKEMEHKFKNQFEFQTRIISKDMLSYRKELEWLYNQRPA